MISKSMIIKNHDIFCGNGVQFIERYLLDV